MVSNNELICFTLLFCFAVFVRVKNIAQERTKAALEKDEASRQQQPFSQELTQQFSDFSSVPSLTSDDFSDDETAPYDATYCISSDMPFSILGKPITDEEHEKLHSTFNHFLNRNSENHVEKLSLKRYKDRGFKGSREERFFKLHNKKAM